MPEERGIREAGQREEPTGGMNGLGNVIRGPVIMTPLITDNYCGYRTRGVISIGPSRAVREEHRAGEEKERLQQNVGEGSA